MGINDHSYESNVSLWLPNTLSGCPKYWRNFVEYANPTGSHTDENRISEILKDRYNAIFINFTAKKGPMGRRCEVRFPSKDEFIMFKLAWR